ncbi:hypothetical protein [Ekhidna sp.]|uniref:hypothetical protein n=1 Tax=Ekhidna sp. TaxID=2608089 RepID=UPI003B504E07
MRKIYSSNVWFLSVVILFTSSPGFAQETSLNNYTGDWGNNSSWSGGWTDGSPAFLSLPETNANITVFGSISVGSSVSSQNLSFAANKEAYDFIINDTLIVHGDVDFANKSMNLTLGNNALFIVLGDLDMNNKINIASGGTVVVIGNFNKSGSQGTYSGDGNVYAGSYSGNAQSTIDNGTGDDSSYTIDQLSDDGFDNVEEFVDGGGSEPLPVELLYFEVNNEKNIVLNWATVSEFNNDYFSIERSEDGENFYEIGKINGHGNSNNHLEYQFTDYFPIATVEYYRLKQVDYDGQYEYFDIKRVSTDVNSFETNMTVFPTTIKSQALSITMNRPSEIREIRLVSLSGGSVKNLNSRLSKRGQLNFDVDTRGLSKGFYLLSVITSEGKQLTSRIIVE